MTVGMKYMSSRTSVMLGATVYSCCFLVTALAEDFNILFITLGVINGKYNVLRGMGTLLRRKFLPLKRISIDKGDKTLLQIC